MQVTKEVRQRVESKIREGLDKAKAYYGHGFDMPKIQYTKRGTTAGTANHRTWTVNFNPILLMENQDDFIERTVPHELAHLIDYKVNPHNFESDVKWTGRGYRRTKRNIHGADFKFIMERVLGADDATRCHNYDVSRAAIKKSTSYEYRCTCGCGKITTLGAKRHQKEQAHPGTYWLRGHGKAKLELVNGSTSTAMTAAAQTPVPPSPHNRSNKDIARDIFQSVGGVRGDFIKHCEAAGIKKVTASTYHHNFKSGKWV